MRQAFLLLPLLVAAVTAPAGAAAPLDITKPILTRDGARGCTSSAALTRLLAAAASTQEGCFAVASGTRGYFMDERGDPPDMILLDIKVDFRMRLLWLPAAALRNP